MFRASFVRFGYCLARYYVRSTEQSASKTKDETSGAVTLNTSGMNIFGWCENVPLISNMAMFAVFSYTTLQSATYTIFGNGEYIFSTKTVTLEVTHFRYSTYRSCLYILWCTFVRRPIRSSWQRINGNLPKSSSVTVPSFRRVMRNAHIARSCNIIVSYFSLI